MNDHDLLIRIDERLTALHEKIPTFVTKKEFRPVRAIAYGFVAIILTLVVTALVNTVVVEASK